MKKFSKFQRYQEHKGQHHYAPAVNLISSLGKRVIAREAAYQEALAETLSIPQIAGAIEESREEGW